MKKITRQSIAAVGVALLGMSLLGGCATKPTANPDWQYDSKRLDDRARLTARGMGGVGVSRAPTSGKVAIISEASADGSRLVVGQPRQFALIDGQNGKEIMRQGDSFFESLRVGVDLSGASVRGFASDSYILRVLDQSRVLLVFDYSYGVDSVVALDLDSGAELWRSNLFNYSYEKYSPVADAAVGMAASALARALRAESSGPTLEERLTREHDFVHKLILPTPDGNGFFFKTLEGVAMVDSRTGRQRWMLTGFEGHGLAEARVLPDGDILLVASTGDITEDYVGTLSIKHHMARVNPRNGQARWLSEHNGRWLDGIALGDELVVLNTQPTQVFDLRNGRLLWENDVRDAPQARATVPILADGALYLVGNTLRENVRMIQLGIPYKLKKHEQRTGKVLWESDEYKMRPTALLRHGDHLLLAGQGEWVGEHGGLVAIDPATGQLRWRSPAFERRGLNAGVDVSEILVKGDTVWVASAGRLYGLDLNSGAVRVEFDHRARGLGVTQGILLDGDDVVVIGRTGVVRVNTTGQPLYLNKTAATADFHTGNGHLTLLHTGTKPGVTVMDLATGSSRSLDYQVGKQVVFGPLAAGAVVSENGDKAITLHQDRVLRSYSVQ